MNFGQNDLTEVNVTGEGNSDGALTCKGGSRITD